MALFIKSVLIGLLGILLYFSYEKLSRASSARTARQHGCQPPISYPHLDPVFGLDLKFREIKRALKSQSIPFNAAIFKKYGETLEVNFFGRRRIWTIAPGNLQTVYATNNQDWGYGPIRFPVMEPFCGKGFVTTDGSDWKDSRALLRPTFSKEKISDLSPFAASVDRFIESIPKDGSAVDLQPLLATLFLNTSMNFLLGQPHGVLNSGGPSSDSKQFLNAFHNSMIGMGLSFVVGPLAFLIPKSLKATAWKQAHSYIDSCVDTVFQRHEESKGNLNLGGHIDPSHNGHSLLEGLTQETHNRTIIRNQLLQAMMAAQDTTSVLISNTIFLLSRNPAVYTRLREEVHSLDLKPSPKLFNSLKEVKLLDHVLKESLRMYPIFPVMVRVALKDTKLPVGGGKNGDFPIYATRGTEIVSNYYALHRIESVFGTDVEVFRPDRWKSIKPGQFEYMPFGGGPRACVGQHKALAEASYTVLRIAQLFKRLESRDDRDWAGQIKLTAKNANGCNVALFPAENE